MQKIPKNTISQKSANLQKDLGQSTKPETDLASGISSLPTPLDYPILMPFSKIIPGMVYYIYKHYGTEGLSVIIDAKDKMSLRVSNWRSEIQDLSSPQIMSLVSGYGETLVKLLKFARVQQAQFYFVESDGIYKLVDVRVAANKMCSPGMIKDVFGRILPTEEPMAIEMVDDRKIEDILIGTGTYSGPLIMKPSKFKLMEYNSGMRPFYIEVVR